MTQNPTDFSKEEFHSVLNELENTLQRSQVLASEAHHINRLQTQQIETFQTTMDNSSRHLKNVDHEIDEIQKGFCIRLCCSSKSKKAKSKKLRGKTSARNSLKIEQDPIYSNDQLRNLDENLQRLQHFNTLIDEELQEQYRTLNHFDHQVDTNTYQLTKAISRSEQLS